MLRPLSLRYWSQLRLLHGEHWESMRAVVATALALLASLSMAQSFRIHLLEDDSSLRGALVAMGHTVTIGPDSAGFDGTGVPANTQIIIWRSWRWDTVPNAAGTAALTDFVLRGGGLIVDGSFLDKGVTSVQAYSSLLPADTFVAMNGASGFSLRVSAANPILNAGLSSDLPLPLWRPGDGYRGWRAKAGATTFYTLRNGEQGQITAGVVGWNVGSGKVLMMPYWDYASQLQAPENVTFLSNMLKWTTRPVKGFLALQNSADGTLSTWNLRGWSNIGTTVLNRQPGANNVVVGTADFNRDGQVDFGVRNTAANQSEMWFASANSIRGSGIATLQYPSPWRIIGYGDVNRDNFPDTFYANGSTVGVLRSQGFNPGSWSTIMLSAGNTPLGIGDFNRDGNPDIMWQQAINRQLFYTRLTSASVLGNTPITPVPAENQTYAFGDIDGDGRSEIVVQNNLTRAVWGWRLNDAGNQATLTNIGTMPTGHFVRALGTWF